MVMSSPFLENLPTFKTDVLIIGAGLAGLITALEAEAAGFDVTLAFQAKNSFTSNSAYAQGGIASFLQWNAQDSLEAHVQDTLIAGAGYNDESAVRDILLQGGRAIETLMRYGVRFDQDDDQHPALTREGGHSHRRILHVHGDQTGLGILTPLIERVKRSTRIRILSQHRLQALHQGENGQIVGASLYHRPHHTLQGVESSQVVLATGGYAGMYRYATHSALEGADALYLAHQAGARLQDLHLVQFHPTAFMKDGNIQFLVSESLRGEGGILLNTQGHRLMEGVHPLGDLAPRDVVARAIDAEMRRTDHPSVYLDMRSHPQTFLSQRFPYIYRRALEAGVNMACDLLPVAPAAHYCMGGIHTTPKGQSSVAGLFAIGEARRTGLHGANRLASNSLLECVVMGLNVVDAFTIQPSARIEQTLQLPFSKTPSSLQHEKTLTDLKSLMWQYLGLQRDSEAYPLFQKKLEMLENANKQDASFKSLYFVAKTALAHAEAMPISCGSHFVKVPTSTF